MDDTVEPSGRPANTTIDGTAIHALSNHLAVILGFIELVLGETKPDDPRRADLMEIRDAAAEMARIIGRPLGDGFGRS
jgi:hypothetical protein